MTHDLATIGKEHDIRATQDLASIAKERGIRYFLISFTDLFGFQRAKLVPATAIADIQKGARASLASRAAST